MKKIFLPLITLVLVLSSQMGNAQCTPVNCLGSLPPYGGICDTILATGRVNVPYNNGTGDYESFVLTSTCFNAQLFDPTLPNVNIRITNVDNFTFANLPAGITGGTNASSYAPPNPGNIAGCAYFTGTPTQIGIFRNTVNFLVDAIVCSFPLNQNDNAAAYGIRMTVLPSPTFTGLASNYCTTDAAVTMTVTGTTGGLFSGPGVSGSTFNPATAGVGTHTVKYKVSRQEGAAILPAADSMMVTVTVGAPVVYYPDNDNDGYGDPTAPQTLCTTPPVGYVTIGGDCNDNVASIHPGAIEVCDINGVDEDCDGLINDLDPSVNPASQNTYYVDADNDGYGSQTVVHRCQIAPGYSANNLDCNDNNSAINPGATEIIGNGVDENCDGSLVNIDLDNDGYDTSVDCNDNNNTVYPGAPELCDGIDNNCVGGIDEGLTMTTYYLDSDNDGYGSTTSISSCSVTTPNGYSVNNTDCNDNNNAIHPGATEICDGLDNDCDGGTDLLDVDANLTTYFYFIDADNDGYGGGSVTISCSSTPPNGYSANNTDCNDGDNTLHPNAPELCDGLDNNCDNNVDEGLTFTTYYRDFDADGFGNNAIDSVSCSQTTPVGYILVGGDCDDANNSIYPNAPEVCDGVDNNCVGGIDEGIAVITYYRDFDTDTYGDPTDSVQTCSNIAPAGYVLDNTDCNDANLNVHPNTLEIANNGEDDDCDGNELIIGLNDLEAEFGIKVFPNPAQNFVTLSGKLTDNLTVTVYDLQGKQISTHAMVQASNYMLDITNLKPGYYMLEVNNKLTHARAFTKIVVIK